MNIIRPLTITDDMLVYCNVPEDDCPHYDPGAMYSVGARVMVSRPNFHKIFVSLEDGNSGKDPATSPLAWEPEGATNRYRAFDSSITTQATNPDNLTFKIKTSGIANGLALLNINCTIIRVTAEDAEFGVVYQRTHNPATNSGIRDWYSYFFEPIVTVRDIMFTDLPLYSNMTITVEMINIGHTVRCGGLVMGHAKVIGETQKGTRIALSSYSLKDRDKFGNFDVIKRAFSRRVTIPLWLENSSVDQVFDMLSQYESVAIVYQASKRFGASIAYGFYRDLSIDIPYTNYSVCSIEIEGLT